MSHRTSRRDTGPPVASAETSPPGRLPLSTHDKDSEENEMVKPRGGCAGLPGTREHGHEAGHEHDTAVGPVVGRGEYRALMVAVGATFAVGVVSSVVPGTDHIAVAVLIGVALARLAVLGVRRESRIRARLGDPRSRPAPRRPGAVPVLRVGPGDRAPAPPAPSTHPPGRGPGHPPGAAARGGS